MLVITQLTDQNRLEMNKEIECQITKVLRMVINLHQIEVINLARQNHLMMVTALDLSQMATSLRLAKAPIQQIDRNRQEMNKR